jgi:HK97 family phage prohead protease
METEIPTQVRRAAFAPSSVNEENRTVQVTWTTGERVKRSSFWDGDFYEELSLDPKHVRMSRLESGRAPFLANHDGQSIRSVLGVIESARLENGRGVATIRFAKDDPEADAAWNKVRQGILPNVSVGYRIHRFEKVEGGDDTTPVFRATDWEPYEVSLVPMGADSMAHVRSANRNPQQEGRTQMETDQQQTENAVAKAERARSAEIRRAVRASALPGELAERMVADGTPLDAARAIVLAELEKRTAAADVEPHIRIWAGEDSQDKFIRGASAWLFERAGNQLISKAKKAGTRGFENVELDGGEFRGMSLFDLAKESLERRGTRTRGMNRTAIVSAAFTRTGYATTSDFGTLLENALGKQLLAGYATQIDTWSRICKVDTVRDFRPSPRYRNAAFGTLDSLNEHGEFENMAIPDGEKVSISTATKGNIIGISRQAVIDDDMSAFADLAVRLGRSARLSIEVDFYALLAQNSGLGPTMSDSQPFFHSSRGNVNGSGSALGAAGIDADRIIMMRQTDPSGNELLDLRPRVLLVPATLGGQAKVLNSSTVKVGGTNGEPNPMAGLFSDIVDTARLTGTRRYLFADPAMAPAFVVAFLEGQGEAPFLEQQQGWRVDGTEWKVRLDYKVQEFDPRGAVTNAGV